MTINVLDLTNNNLFDGIADDIELIISCNKLEELYLGGNNLHDTGIFYQDSKGFAEQLCS